MGKGYHNYMSKKFFHPGNFDNIKRVWMAEQKDAHDKKQEEDTLAQYQKEQEMYQNRALLGDEKAKLGLNFMYDPPPGVKRDREKEEDEPEYKFEWQRKYNAPRESYAKGDDTVRDQPFGIEVRNVRCLKCRKWGHINTDKVCPLFGKSITAEPPQCGSNQPGELMEQMKEDGFQFTKKVLSRQNDPTADNQQMIDSEAEEDEEIAFFLSLSHSERKKLVKKLEKQRKKEKKSRRKERQLNNMQEVTKDTMNSKKENANTSIGHRRSENNRDESREGAVRSKDMQQYYGNGARRTTARDRSIERKKEITNGNKFTSPERKIQEQLSSSHRSGIQCKQSKGTDNGHREESRSPKRRRSRSPRDRSANTSSNRSARRRSRSHSSHRERR